MAHVRTVLNYPEKSLRMGQGVKKVSKKCNTVFEQSLISEKISAGIGERSRAIVALFWEHQYLALCLLVEPVQRGEQLERLCVPLHSTRTFRKHRTVKNKKLP